LVVGSPVVAGALDLAVPDLFVYSLFLVVVSMPLATLAGIAHNLRHAPGAANMPRLTRVPEFSLDQSWLVPETARRQLGLGLMVATVASFVLLALGVWGVPGLSAAWPALTVVSCLLSAVLLVLFWDIHLVFGLAIDLALLAVVVARPPWAEQVIGAGG
jgi:hypothetical protein